MHNYWLVKISGVLYIYFVAVLQFVTLFISQSKESKARKGNEVFIYHPWALLPDKGAFVWVLFH